MSQVKYTLDVLFRKGFTDPELMGLLIRECLSYDGSYVRTKSPPSRWPKADRDLWYSRVGRHGNQKPVPTISGDLERARLAVHDNAPRVAV